jgi:excisionase family DNA binding protein
MTGQLMTAEQLAARWQVKPSAIYRQAREDHIPVVRVGRYYRFAPNAIEAYERGEWKQTNGAQR